MSPRAPGYTSVRTYSILACGGLLTLHDFEGAGELFGRNEHAVFFHDEVSLKKQLRELDADEEKRMQIADAGRRLHATKHTVAHRVLNIVRNMLGVADGFDGWL